MARQARWKPAPLKNSKLEDRWDCRIVHPECSHCQCHWCAKEHRTLAAAKRHSALLNRKRTR